MMHGADLARSAAGALVPLCSLPVKVPYGGLEVRDLAPVPSMSWWWVPHAKPVPNCHRCALSRRRGAGGAAEALAPKAKLFWERTGAPFWEAFAAPACATPALEERAAFICWGC